MLSVPLFICLVAVTVIVIKLFGVIDEIKSNRPRATRISEEPWSVLLLRRTVGRQGQTGLR